MPRPTHQNHLKHCLGGRGIKMPLPTYQTYLSISSKDQTRKTRFDPHASILKTPPYIPPKPNSLTSKTQGQLEGFPQKAYPQSRPLGA